MYDDDEGYNFVYSSESLEEVVLSIRRECIVTFFYTVKDSPAYDLPAFQQFDDLKELAELNIYQLEKFLPYDRVNNYVRPCIRMDENHAFALLEIDCDVIIERCMRILYLRLCSEMYEEGIIDVYFDSVSEDFVFKKK